MSQAGAVEIILTAPKDLCFALQGTEGWGVENPIAVDLEGAAIIFAWRFSR